MIRFSLFLGMAAVLLVGCKPDEEVAQAETLRITAQLMNGDTPISTGDIFTTDEGYRVRVDQLDFYISGLTGTNADGAIDAASTDVWLLKMENMDDRVTLSIPPSDAVTLTGFEIGVPEEINTNPDPSSYPTDHPLSDFSGMYWSWNSGYKFIQIEGRIDLTGTEGADLTDFLSIHTGLESNRESLNVSVQKANDCERIDYRMLIDVSQWFNAVHTIDLATDNQTHTTDNPELAEQFSDNFAASLSVE